MLKPNNNALLTAALAAGFAGSAVAGTITWDAGGDGVSTYAEANWTAVDGAPGTDPPAGTVDGNAEASGGLIHDFVVGGSATAGGAGGAGPNFDLSDATTLTVQDDATFRMGSPGIRGGTPFDNLTRANVVIQDNGTVITTYMVEIDVTMTGNSDLEFKGGGNPVNLTTVDLDSAWTGEVRFNNETVSAATTEHLSKIFVNGAPAVVGVNVDIVSDGGPGSILTVIPEPTSLALLALGGVLVGVRRRR